MTPVSPDHWGSSWSLSPGARLLPRLATLEGSGWVGRTEPWLGGLWQARWLEAALWLGVLGPREWLCEFRLSAAWGPPWLEWGPSAGSHCASSPC